MLGYQSILENKEFSSVAIPRNKQTFIDAPSSIFVIDIDEYTTKDQLDYTQSESIEKVIESYIVKELPKEFHNCSYIVKLSQSAGMKGKDTISFHLIFMTDHSWKLEEQAAFIKQLQQQGLASNSDTSIYRSTQMVFTAGPGFEGIEDPVTISRVLYIEKGKELLSLDLKFAPTSKSKNKRF